MKILVTACIFSVIAFSTAALADSKEVPADGTCPNFSDPENQDVRGRSRPAHWVSGMQIALPAAKLYQAPDKLVGIDGEDLTFGDSVEVFSLVGSSERDPDSMFLVRNTKGGNDRCGWLFTDAVGNYEAVRDVVSIPGERDRKGIDGVTPSRLKARVVARASGELGEKLRPIQLHNDASIAPENVIGELNFFAIADVLDVRRASGDGTCTSIYEDDDCFFLLGGAAIVDDATVPSIIGWVRTTEVSLWTSPLSIFFAPDRNDVPVFNDQCLVLKYKDQNRKCRGGNADVPPFLGSFQIPDKNNIPRFPVTDVDTKFFGGQNEWLYTMVAPLEVCDENRSTCRSSEQDIKSLGELGALLQEASNVDILIVLDASASMEVYFKPALLAAKDFAKDLVGRDLNARFGALVYEDYLTENGTVDNLSYAAIAPFGAVGDWQSLDILSRAPAVQNKVKDLHEDLPEAPYAALIRGMSPQVMEWSPNAGVRLIVWIADIGNRDPGTHKTKHPKGKVTERITAQDVEAAARRMSEADGVQTVFAAIHVPGRGGANARADFKRDYLAFAGDENFPAIIVDGATGSARQKAQTAVRDAFDKMLKSTIEVKENIEAQGLGRKPKNIPTLKVTKRIIEGLLKKRGGSAAPLQDGDILAVEEYFVRQDIADPDFEYWLGLDARTIRGLDSTLQDLCSSLGATDIFEDVDTAWVEVMDIVTRDRPPRDMSVSEFLEQKLSVPKAQFSELVELGDTVEGIVARISNDGDVRARYQKEVCIKSILVSLARSNERIPEESVAFIDGFAEPNEDEIEKFNWYWHPPGGVRTYFIPLAWLP